MSIIGNPITLGGGRGGGGQIVIRDTTDAAGGTVRTIIAASYTERSASSVTVSGDTVTVPAGAYAENVTKSVESGSAGTPIATKGTVSNHSVPITPSVTNTEGYINGGTKIGTAVSVSASELVSGNKAIVDNGTNIDVTNYATVSVAVPFVTVYSGSTTPSSSTGSDGDIYLQTS